MQEKLTLQPTVQLRNVSSFRYPRRRDFSIVKSVSERQVVGFKEGPLAERFFQISSPSYVRFWHG